MKVSRSAIHRVVEACLEVGAKRAEIFLSPTLRVSAARMFKKDGRDSETTIMLTIGKPNYRGREFVKDCQKAGEPFPVRKMQLTWYKPTKK